MKSTSRRFPPPWMIDETDACFIVRDGKGRALAYGARSSGVHLHLDNAATGQAWGAPQ